MPSEFLSPTGSARSRGPTGTIRASSVRTAPSIAWITSPAESTTGLFGGNSNWRGPMWFPVNYLLIESLQKFHHFLGSEFNVECPTGSGREMTWGGRRGAVAPAHPDFPARTRTATAGARRNGSVPDGPALAGPGAVLRVLPRRRRRGRRREPSDRLDRARREAAAAERRVIWRRDDADRGLGGLSREWLETNGLGGFASSTSTGDEHAPLPRPARRRDQAARRTRGAALEARGDARRRRQTLRSLRRTAIPGAMHPQGYRYLNELSPRSVSGVHVRSGRRRAREAVFMAHGENTTRRGGS